jgi:CDP-paratose 2-epimerase
VSGRKQNFTYSDQNRVGDHICYYSDLTKMKHHYPQWDITRSLRQIVSEIADAWRERLGDVREHGK